MADGPNYEKVFRGMQCLHGGNPEDVKIIKRFLRFFEGEHEYEVFAKHYLPMLSEEDRKEFPCPCSKECCDKEEEVTEEVHEEPAVEEVVEEPKELSIEEVNAELEKLGIKPHHKAGEAKRRELLAEATK